MSSITSGLLGYWGFDGNANDISGNGNNLALHGGATYGAGLSGQALQLDGSAGSYAVATTNNPALDLSSGDFTIQLWAKFNSEGGQNTLTREETLIEKFSGASGPGWTFTLPQNDIHFYDYPNITNYNTPMTTDTWHEFTEERSGNTLSTYFDGQLVAAGPVSAPFSSSSNPLLIGTRDAADGRNFTVDGSIDNVAIWGRALSADEIASSWNSGAGLQINFNPKVENITQIGSGSGGTAQNTTLISGTAEAGSTVSIFDGTQSSTQAIGTAQADAQGNWSLSTNAPSNVIHSYTEKATDTSGVTTTSTGAALYTPAANKVLSAGSGDDVLIGRPNDTLTGGAGHDTFVFNPSFGKEAVTNFQLSKDVVAFDHTLFSSASDVLAHAQAVSGGVSITDAGGDVLTLQNVTLDSLKAASADWVHFV
ncbi:LamG-like jellyroll fold domain-containing protein [Methylobacterium sp. P31]